MAEVPPLKNEHIFQGTERSCLVKRSYLKTRNLFPWRIQEVSWEPQENSRGRGEGWGLYYYSHLGMVAQYLSTSPQDCRWRPFALMDTAGSCSGRDTWVGPSLWRRKFRSRARGLYWGQATNQGWFLPCHPDTILWSAFGDHPPQPPNQGLAMKQHIVKKTTLTIFSRVGMWLQCWWRIYHLISITSSNQKKALRQAWLPNVTGFEVCWQVKAVCQWLTKTSKGTSGNAAARAGSQKSMRKSSKIIWKDFKGGRYVENW